MKLRTNHHSRRPWFGIVLGIAFAIALVVYILGRTSALRRGPEVTTNITSGDTFLKQSIMLEGSAEHTVDLAVNGKTIILDDKGQFREPLLLSIGYNIIVLEARDRFGKTTTYQYEVVSQPRDQEPESTETTENPEDSTFVDTSDVE